MCSPCALGAAAAAAAAPRQPLPRPQPPRLGLRIPRLHGCFRRLPQVGLHKASRMTAAALPRNNDVRIFPVKPQPCSTSSSAHLSGRAARALATAARCAARPWAPAAAPAPRPPAGSAARTPSTTAPVKEYDRNYPITINHTHMQRQRSTWQPHRLTSAGFSA